jgi:hypothetical protein
VAAEGRRATGAGANERISNEAPLQKERAHETPEIKGG